MRWAFRHSSSAGAPVGSKRDSNAEPEPQAPDDQAPAAAAWRSLPGMEPVLGAMPIVTDAGFSQSLPTRWHTAPALGSLGHDVRTDVPGGLVTGVARTVDPRDTRPADLVWRMPDLGGLSTPAGVTLQASDAADLPTATRSAAAGRAPAVSATTSRIPHALAPTISPLPIGNDTRRPRISTPTPETAPAQGAADSFQTPVSRGDVLTDTGETRQGPQDADLAVEARDPRPGPANVAAGRAAAPPDRRVNTGSEPKMLDSLLSGSTTGVASPARTAPLSTPLPPPPSTPTPPPSTPPALTADSTEFGEPPARQDEASEPVQENTSSSIVDSPTIAEAAQPTSAMTNLPLRIAVPAPVPDPTAPTTTPPMTSQVAPIISATRFVAATAPINVLRAPTAPVDQPVRAVESIVGSFVSAFANGPFTSAPSANAGALDAAPGTSVDSTLSASLEGTLTQSATPAAIAPVVNTMPGGQAPGQSLANQVFAAATAAPTPAVSTTVGAANDHAALDTLARQLYGRFSRHLAGELLIDRERAQFLTDLT